MGPSISSYGQNNQFIFAVKWASYIGVCSDALREKSSKTYLLLLIIVARGREIMARPLASANALILYFYSRSGLGSFILSWW